MKDLQNLHTHSTYCDGRDTPEEMIALAKENGIVMMSTNKTLYTTCGLLYSNGLVGTAEVAK